VDRADTDPGRTLWPLKSSRSFVATTTGICWTHRNVEHIIFIRMMAIQVFYDGNVQGVGFRWSVRNIAKGFDLTGWIRNLIDGRVEMRVSGEEDEVRAFLKAIMESELRAHIRKQSETQLDALVEARGFEIRS
jgi:acylphosphatase